MKESKINHIIRCCIRHSNKLYRKARQLEAEKKYIAYCGVNNARWCEIRKAEKWFKIRREEYGY